MLGCNFGEPIPQLAADGSAGVDAGVTGASADAVQTLWLFGAGPTSVAYGTVALDGALARQTGSVPGSVTPNSDFATTVELEDGEKKTFVAVITAAGAVQVWEAA